MFTSVLSQIAFLAPGIFAILMKEIDRSIYPSMFLHCLFKDPKVEKLRNIINTFIISLCKNSYAIAMFFWLWL